MSKHMVRLSFDIPGEEKFKKKAEGVNSAIKKRNGTGYKRN